MDKALKEFFNDGMSDDGPREDVIALIRDALRETLAGIVIKGEIKDVSCIEVSYALLHTAAELNPHEDPFSISAFNQFLDEALNECIYPADMFFNIDQPAE
jgi:hypothetical protein